MRICSLCKTQHCKRGTDGDTAHMAASRTVALIFIDDASTNCISTESTEVYTSILTALSKLYALKCFT